MGIYISVNLWVFIPFNVLKYEGHVFTRMHSSRMRTDCLLAVSPNMHCSWGGGWGGGGGDSASGVVYSWGRGGVCSPGGLSQHALRQTPLWTEWQTGAKILPCPKIRLRAVKIARFYTKWCFNRVETTQFHNKKLLAWKHNKLAKAYSLLTLKWVFLQ